MKKAIFSLLLMAASVIGASAQGSATTAQNPQDVDVLYAKNLLVSWLPKRTQMKAKLGRVWRRMRGASGK